ncbi:MAG TPA: leucine-rich repeat protein [Verrucomicrobiae bacterium]|nr:leucine-rich repeat protein [Verrucomicrobiae bacterium]
MKIRRYLIQTCLLGTLLAAASPCSVLAQVLFFDNFQPFVNGTVLTSTNYTPRFGPATASVVTSVQNGSPTITVSNFLRYNWALFNNPVTATNKTVTTNENQYEGILSSVQTNQTLQMNWNMWIAATNAGAGMFQLSVPTSNPNPNFNPLILFTDTGAIIALTNGTNVQVPIGNWGLLAGTVMTNSLLLDYPDGTYSYSLNGQTLATLPLGRYFTNVVGAIYFNGFERSAGSLGNRFALANVEVEAFTSSNNFIYIITNGTITITGYTGTDSAVTIPGTINGLPVTSIGNYAFENETSVTSVTIPGSVTSIGSYAFLGSGLTSVTIGGSVTNIGVAAFGYCSSLTNVTIPGSVTSIGGIAFILDPLTRIYFLGNAPHGDSTVFSGANGTVYYVPGTSGWSNSYCDWPAVQWYQPHPIILGSNYGLGVNTNGFGFTVSWATNLSMIVEATTNLADLFWNQLVTNKLSNGFFNFRDPDWTNFPRRFYRLAGTNVFTFFTASPTNGVAPFAVQFNSSTIDNFGNAIVGWQWKFGDGATSTAQNPSHTYTNAGIFSPGFVATNIHGGLVTGYGPQIATFSYLTATNNGAITITGFAGSLVRALTIPGTINGLPVTGIGPRAFYFCPGLTNVTIPDSVTCIRDYAFSSCANLRSVVLGNNVTNIGSFAFAFCSRLTGLTIPNSVTSIGTNAFGYCASLTSIVIPNSVTSIGMFAFGSCGNLSNVGIGAGVTNIGALAFTFCTSLTGLDIPPSVTGIGISAFSSCSNLASLNIPNGDVGDLAFDSCTSLNNVALGNGVSRIGNFTFTGCTSLTGISIPGQVANIGVNAFYSCAHLASVTIAGGDIGDYAFSACGNLSNVVLGNGVANIGVGAFASCSNLIDITIPAGVANIGGGAFRGCGNLVNVTIAGAVGDFGYGAFSGDNNLQAVYFQGNAPALPGIDGLFYGVNAAVAKIYYLPGTTGWTNPFAGLPIVLWNPVVQTATSDFGLRSNQFGFSITGTANIPIVVGACTNLAHPMWAPLFTGTLTNGSLYFSDPAWGSYPGRFYRISSQ